MLKYLHENGCPWNNSVCVYACKNNNLEMLKYAIENECFLNDKFLDNNSLMYMYTARNGNLEMLKYLDGNNFSIGYSVCEYAAEKTTI